MRYFDDFAVGERFTTATALLTEGMVLDFARNYDPQPFHVDAEAAKQTIFGGLIASGFQSLALGFRLVLDTGVFRRAAWARRASTSCAGCARCGPATGCAWCSRSWRRGRRHPSPTAA